MLEKVFEKLCRIYKAKPLELTKEAKIGLISLCFNEWKIVLSETIDGGCSISAIPNLPFFKNISQELIERWKLISESCGRFDYSGPVLGKQMKRRVLETLGKYPPEKKATVAIESIKSVLMSPETSWLYAFYKFKVSV